MRRLSALVSILVVALIGGVVLGRSVSAQDATPVAEASLAGHPLVGAWVLDTDTADPENPPSLVVFTADGIYNQHDYDGTAGVGSWDATGPTSANLTFFSYFPDEEGNLGGGSIVRAELEVAADGHSLTATYTVEVINPAGPFGEQYGPGTASGERIAVESMGEPVGSLDDLFSDSEE